MPEYLSFEDVVAQLGLSEDEVKRLVSEGELRAFRDEDRMKFRKEDVDSLASNRSGGGEEGTILDLDNAVDFESGELPAASDTAVPEVDFGEQESKPAPIDTTGTPEADFGDAEGTIIEPPEEEAGSDKGDTTGITQEMVFEDSDDLKVQKEDSSSVGAAESDETFAEDSSKTATEEELVDAPTEGAESAAVEEEEAEARPAPRAARPAAPAEPGHHPVMTICLFLCSAAMWILGSLLVDLVRVAMSESPASPAGLNRSVIKLFAGAVDKSTK